MREKIMKLCMMSGVSMPFNRLLRLIRAEQKRKCRECIDRTVKNIEAREKERLGGKPK